MRVMENTFRSVKQLGPVRGPRLPAPWLSTWIHTPVGPLWPATSLWSRGGRPLAGQLAATPSPRNGAKATPKSFPKRSQNDPNRCATIQKRSKHMRKSFANGSLKSNQMQAQNRPKIVPKSSQNRSKIDPKSFQNQPTIVPKSTKNRSKRGS